MVFGFFNNLVKLFTVQNWLELDPELPTHTSILLIKGCQLFRKYICNETHHYPFGSGLTAANEVCKHIFYILDDIYISFTNVYTVYCGSWLSDAEAKYQISLFV